jgi:hypothetical protein
MNERREDFISLFVALENWFDKPQSELPKQLKQRVDVQFLPFFWDSLSPNQRRHLALQCDYKHDPATEKGREFWFNFGYQKASTKLAIDNISIRQANTNAEQEAKEAELNELQGKLHNMQLFEKNSFYEYHPHRKFESNAKFIPYMVAFKRLSDRVGATHDEMAMWVWLSDRNGGLHAYTNANELVPPPDFYFMNFGEAGDYVADLMCTWFLETDIESFNPKKRYITGAALIQRWGEQLGTKLNAYVKAKIAESVLLDMHPHVGITQWDDSVSSASRDSALFELEQVLGIEEEEGIVPVLKRGNESPKVRNERLVKRVNELKSQGVRSFLKQAAAEEGVSTSRVKQIISQEETQPAKAKSEKTAWDGLRVPTSQTTSRKKETKY